MKMKEILRSFLRISGRIRKLRKEKEVEENIKYEQIKSDQEIKKIYGKVSESRERKKERKEG